MSQHGTRKFAIVSQIMVKKETFVKINFGISNHC